MDVETLVFRRSLMFIPSLEARPPFWGRDDAMEGSEEPPCRVLSEYGLVLIADQIATRDMTRDI